MLLTRPLVLDALHNVSRAYLGFLWNLHLITKAPKNWRNRTLQQCSGHHIKYNSLAFMLDPGAIHSDMHVHSNIGASREPGLSLQTQKDATTTQPSQFPLGSHGPTSGQRLCHSLCTLLTKSALHSFTPKTLSGCSGCKMHTDNPPTQAFLLPPHPLRSLSLPPPRARRSGWCGEAVLPEQAAPRRHLFGPGPLGEPHP